MRFLKMLGALVAPALLFAGLATATPAAARHHDPVCVDAGTQQVVACPAGVSGNDQSRDHAKRGKDKVGGEYFVVTYYGLPGHQQNAHRLTPTQWDQLAYLDRLCRGDLKAQRPSGLSELFHTTVVGAIGGSAGYAAGYQVSHLGPVDKVTKLGGVVGAVSGFVQGLDSRGRAKKYDLGQCMAVEVNWAQKLDGQLMNVAILMNAHAVNGKRLRRPDGPDAPVVLTRAPNATDSNAANPVVILH